MMSGGGEEGDAQHNASDDGCCGRRNRRQYINSPMTLLPLPHIRLAPVRQVVSLIETWIEKGRTPARDAAEWRERRAQVVARNREQAGSECADSSLPIAALKQGWLIRQIGRVADTWPKRYAVLLADRLVIYETESSRVADAAFELLGSTTVQLEANRMMLRTPAAHGQQSAQELVLLEAEDAGANSSLHEWCTAISNTIARRPAPYCGRAADTRISYQPDEGPHGSTRIFWSRRCHCSVGRRLAYASRWRLRSEGVRRQRRSTMPPMQSIYLH